MKRHTISMGFSLQWNFGRKIHLWPASLMRISSREISSSIPLSESPSPSCVCSSSSSSSPPYNSFKLSWHFKLSWSSLSSRSALTCSAMLDSKYGSTMKGSEEDGSGMGLGWFFSPLIFLFCFLQCRIGILTGSLSEFVCFCCFRIIYSGPSARYNLILFLESYSAWKILSIALFFVIFPIFLGFAKILTGHFSVP